VQELQDNIRQMTDKIEELKLTYAAHIASKTGAHFWATYLSGDAEQSTQSFLDMLDKCREDNGMQRMTNSQRAQISKEIDKDGGGFVSLGEWDQWCGRHERFVSLSLELADLEKQLAADDVVQGQDGAREAQEALDAAKAAMAAAVAASDFDKVGALGAQLSALQKQQQAATEQRGMEDAHRYRTKAKEQMIAKLKEEMMTALKKSDMDTVSLLSELQKRVNEDLEGGPTDADVAAASGGVQQSLSLNTQRADIQARMDVKKAEVAQALSDGNMDAVAEISAAVKSLQAEMAQVDAQQASLTGDSQQHAADKVAQLEADIAAAKAELTQHVASGNMDAVPGLVEKIKNLEARKADAEYEKAQADSGQSSRDEVAFLLGYDPRDLALIRKQMDIVPPVPAMARAVGAVQSEQAVVAAMQPNDRAEAAEAELAALRSSMAAPAPVLPAEDEPAAAGATEPAPAPAPAEDEPAEDEPAAEVLKFDVKHQVDGEKKNSFDPATLEVHPDSTLVITQNGAASNLNIFGCTVGEPKSKRKGQKFILRLDAGSFKGIFSVTCLKEKTALEDALKKHTMAYIRHQGQWRGPGRYICVNDGGMALRTEPNEKSKHETLRVMHGQTINVRGIVDVTMDLTSTWAVSKYLELGEQTDEDNNELSGTVGFLPLFMTSANDRKKGVISPIFLKKLTTKPPTACLKLSGFETGHANINGYYVDTSTYDQPRYTLAEWVNGPHIYWFSPRIGQDVWCIRGKKLCDKDGYAKKWDREETLYVVESKPSKEKMVEVPKTGWFQPSWVENQGTHTLGTIETWNARNRV
jgi:hypothetical protein